MLKCLDGLDWELIQDEDGNTYFCLESAANDRSLTGSVQRPPIRLGTDGLFVLILSIEAYPRASIGCEASAGTPGRFQYWGFNRNLKQLSTPERDLLPDRALHGTARQRRLPMLYAYGIYIYI